MRGRPEVCRPAAPGPGCRLMLVLDAGAFGAVQRGDRDVVALAKRQQRAGRPPALAEAEAIRADQCRARSFPAVGTALLRSWTSSSPTKSSSPTGSTHPRWPTFFQQSGSRDLRAWHREDPSGRSNSAALPHDAVISRAGEESVAALILLGRSRHRPPPLR